MEVKRKYTKKSVCKAGILLLAFGALAGCGRELHTDGKAAVEESEQESGERTVAGEEQGTEIGEITEIETETVTKEREYVSFDYPEWNLLAKAEKNRTIDTVAWEEKAEEGTLLFADIPVEEAVYALYVPQGTVKLAYYDADRNYLEGGEEDAAEGIFLELPDGCGYLSCAIEQEAAGESFLVKEEKTAEQPVIFAGGEREEINTIQNAVDGIAWEGTVIILPGTYHEQVKAWGKKVHFYGADRERCILESYSASYYAPPLEIAAGSVKNLTIQACNVDGRTAEKYAYGVHVEDNALYGETLLFENCDIRSDYNSAVGMGMRGGCQVQFINVNLQGKEWGLFCHDCAGTEYGGYQRLCLTDCVVEGMTGQEALCLDSQGVAGTTVEVTFVNTVLKNENAADGEHLLVTRNQGGTGEAGNWRGLKNYILNEKSTGNNVEDMNSF